MLPFPPIAGIKCEKNMATSEWPACHLPGPVALMSPCPDAEEFARPALDIDNS